ncbi:WecB/TagA/CpsF family glycosyltransferase [Trichlorobacter lovleyi]|nr:WecB/TagA/CpsF family glycosyltransferase [Trichlorobacter lovleyi]
MNKTVDFIEHGIDNNKFIQHVVVNVAKIVNAQCDPELKSSIEACNIVNVDGMGVVWGARFIGLKVPERVAGVDLFCRLIELSQYKAYPVFLLGATQEVIEKTVVNLKMQFPGLNIAGCHHGYFWGYEENVVGIIKNSGAKLLFVAITSPKKENFINRWRDHLGVNFVMGVGGTFDVVAGKIKRAPLWMQKAGLEWFYRVIQEPNRMWKRYLLTNTKFLFMLLHEKFVKWPKMHPRK